MFLMRQNFDAKIILTYAACLDTVFLADYCKKIVKILRNIFMFLLKIIYYVV